MSGNGDFRCGVLPVSAAPLPGEIQCLSGDCVAPARSSLHTFIIYCSRSLRVIHIKAYKKSLPSHSRDDRLFTFAVPLLLIFRFSRNTQPAEYPLNSQPVDRDSFSIPLYLIDHPLTEVTRNGVRKVRHTSAPFIAPLERASRFHRSAPRRVQDSFGCVAPTRRSLNPELPYCFSS